MGREEAVKRAVGKADAFELLSCAFAYPDERLAQGLVDGSFADDARACLLDAGADPAAADSTAEALGAMRRRPICWPICASCTRACTWHPAATPPSSRTKARFCTWSGG